MPTAVHRRIMSRHRSFTILCFIENGDSSAADFESTELFARCSRHADDEIPRRRGRHYSTRRRGRRQVSIIAGAPRSSGDTSLGATAFSGGLPPLHCSPTTTRFAGLSADATASRARHFATGKFDGAMGFRADASVDFTEMAMMSEHGSMISLGPALLATKRFWRLSTLRQCSEMTPTQP